MKLKTIKDIKNLKNKRVLVRLDLDVPMRKGKVADDSRLKVAVPTIKYLVAQKAKVIIIGHLGRPEGKRREEYSLRGVAKRLEKILSRPILFLDDCVGGNIQNEISAMKAGQIILLENLRFYKEETENNVDFSKQLAELGDIYINEAFANSHRAHSSTLGITKYLPSYAGFNLQKEAENLEMVMKNFKKPSVVIIGGIKIETKLPLIKILANKYDFVLVGSGIAGEVLDKNIKLPANAIMPLDYAVNRLDIGPKAAKQFQTIIASAKTIIWNGPVGKFETSVFARGTKKIIESILLSKARILIGGGDTLEAINKCHAPIIYKKKNISVSMGGGAMLQFLEKGTLPALTPLIKYH